MKNFIKELKTLGKNFWFGSGNIPIEHNGNEFTANVEKDFLLSTRKKEFEELGISEIIVRYADGAFKSFDEFHWHAFGNNIMKNVPKIKIIVLKVTEK